MYRSVWRIKMDNRIYEPGDIITGLSDVQAKELLSMKAIEISPVFHEEKVVVNMSHTVSKEDKQNTGSIDQMGAFRKTLEAMKRSELISYAKKVDVAIDTRMKNSEICDLLFEDAKENGVDIELLDEQSLMFLALELNCQVSSEMDREQLIKTIDRKLGEYDNE
ncbi:hypothetical protein [Anoxybacillus sp. MB8]|uniref:hypothetical protein n=1 Tax=Anoxybacillus sp. MB8 TaxID=2496850 RepID=UPI0013D2D224|nr:hypothetical protein [Anoxybacillus sp. MB8]